MLLGHQVELMLTASSFTARIFHLENVGIHINIYIPHSIYVVQCNECVMLLNCGRCNYKIDVLLTCELQVSHVSGGMCQERSWNPSSLATPRQ